MPNKLLTPDAAMDYIFGSGDQWTPEEIEKMTAKNPDKMSKRELRNEVKERRDHEAEIALYHYSPPPVAPWPGEPLGYDPYNSADNEPFMRLLVPELNDIYEVAP